MQWWCSAQGVAWSWTWRPYVGVWVLVAGLLFLYWRGTSDRGSRGFSFAAGVAALWVALDWPVGALAAGYLASVHMVQFLLVGLVAPALLIMGVPPVWFERLVGRRSIGAVLELVTRPLIALITFNLIVAVTHWPRVVDTLMVTQAGSFVIDMAWLVGGLMFWWPVVAPFPERPRFGYVLKIGYLIAATILAIAPFLFLTFSTLPVYATYELAPPVDWISKQDDQRLAGILMKLGGGLILWTAITALFFKWYREEEHGW